VLNDHKTILKNAHFMQNTRILSTYQYHTDKNTWKLVTFLCYTGCTISKICPSTDL